MAETNDDLKQPGNEPGDANGQASKQNQVDPAELDGIDKDIDNLLGKEDDDDEDDDTDSDNGDTVVLSKSEVEKLKRDKNNYREGLKSTKGKLKSLKDKLITKPQSQETKPDDPNAPMTKADYEKQEIQKTEREAQHQFEGESKVFSEHRDGIMQFYVPRRGNKTVSDALEDLRDAETIFMKRNPELASEDGEGKKAQSDLSKGAKPSGSTKGSGKKGERTRVLPKSETPKQWY